MNEIKYANKSQYVKIQLLEAQGKYTLIVDNKSDTKGYFKKFVTHDKVQVKKIETNIYKTSDLKEIKKIFNWAVKKDYVSSTDQAKVKKIIQIEQKNPKKPIEKNEAKDNEARNKVPADKQMHNKQDRHKEIVRPKKILGDTPAESPAANHAPGKHAVAQPLPAAAKPGAQEPSEKRTFPKTNELLKRDEIFLDPHRLLKGSKDNKMSPEHTAWTVGYALLNLNRDGLTPEVQKELDFLIFQAYSKAAYSSKGAEIGMQESPKFIPGEQYHRLGTEFLRDLDDHYQTDLKLQGGAEIHLIDSPLFKEVLERRYTCKTITSMKDLESFIDKSLASHEKDAPPMIVDLSKIAGPRDAEMFDKILKRKVDAYNKIHKHKISKSDFDYMNPIIFTEHKGEKILIIPEKQGGETIEYSELIGGSGFHLSPDRAKKAFLKIKPLAEGVIASGELATAGSSMPTVFENVKKFAAANIIRQFGELSNDPHASLNVKRQAKATANLIAGLARHDIDEACAKKNLTPFLQMAYFVLGNAMHMAMDNKDNVVEFNNQIELIHQVLQSILEVAQPYGPRALEASTVAGLKNSHILPAALSDPKVHLKSSAMHCFSSVLSAVEKQKGQTALNVAVIKDSYYETQDVIKGANKHKTAVLDLDDFNKNPANAVRNLKNMPLDVFICEFHHNTQLEKHEYSPIKVREQIKEIITQNKGHPVTIVIDNTIGLEHSEELRTLLADVDIQKSIQGGKLNLVLLRSAQKYDMLGQDNYYGGITTTFNAPESFAAFNTRMDDPADQLVGFNYQGLAHIHTHAQAEVDAYRSALAQNTDLLYKQLLAKGVTVGETEEYDIQIAKRNDQNIPFIHIRGATTESLFEFAQEKGLALTDRASFGFSNANITAFDDGLRLNLGLEDEHAIEQYAQFIADAQKASKRAA